MTRIGNRGKALVADFLDKDNDIYLLSHAARGLPHLSGEVGTRALVLGFEEHL